MAIPRGFWPSFETPSPEMSITRRLQGAGAPALTPAAWASASPTAVEKLRHARPALRVSAAKAAAEAASVTRCQPVIWRCRVDPDQWVSVTSMPPSS
ncbi:MAG TPA: hypothetical protein VLA52_15640 [Thermohalobaculum sp.]|nr:hypothetical protein [Thermohalobaculum sp.]